MRTQRIRDPIHGLIVFDENDDVDMAVWRLLQSAEMQRLRRIKQLGVSEFVFPSATHTRFAHSVGVFHNARQLMNLIRREIKLQRVEGEFDPERARVAMFAALLHDIGHGPFSHAFEEARKAIAIEKGGTAADRARIRGHEAFTADMIEDPTGEIGEICTECKTNPQEVADLIRAEIPKDMYHAIVSSSFDADRLDYLLRDRYMTGTGAGAIDFGWLMDNVRVAEIDVSAPDGSAGDPEYRHSFCLSHKARDAAEDFLLARYRLYTNVYLHKTTRGIEQLVSAFFRSIARDVAAGSLDLDQPLFRFFGSEETLQSYRALDDTVVWGALHAVASHGKDLSQAIALRILNRQKPLCLDIQQTFPEDTEKQRRLKHALDRQFRVSRGVTVLPDVAKLSIYGEIGADDSRAQKRLMIQLSDSNLKEITHFHDATITRSDKDRYFERYYFLNEKEFQMAQSAADSVRERRA
jgi:uncharacterized protein